MYFIMYFIFFIPKLIVVFALGRWRPVEQEKEFTKSHISVAAFCCAVAAKGATKAISNMISKDFLNIRFLLLI